MAIGVSLTGLAGGCGTPGPDGDPNTYGLDFSLPPEAPRTGAIVFVVDGVNARIFADMLDKGELPAIQKYFVDRGLYVRHAVANTPSVTLANLTSIATGVLPGHHGIVGINWFDRNQLIWRNYETICHKNTLDADHTTPLIYEYFANRTTFSVFFQPHRGATKFIENWTSAGPPFFFGWYQFVDRLTLFRLHIVTNVARQRRELPAVTVCYLLAPDFQAYAHGVQSKQYRAALRHTDRQIGRVLGDVARAGLLDDVTLAFVSDHSLGEVTKHFHLKPFCRDVLGLDVAPMHLHEKTPFEKRLAAYSRYSTVLYGSGDRYWALCLRKPRTTDGRQDGFHAWPTRPDVNDLRAYPTTHGPTDLPARLVQEPAVDAVAFATDRNVVRVLRANGEVEFRQPAGRGGKIFYRVVQGDDPLGWKAALPPAVGKGKGLSPREWLALTAETNYPDLPEQILAYFRAKRAGDIAVFATPGWDFNTRNRAGHGGLRPEDMHTPMLLAGPGIPHETRTTARTIDLAPTLLRLLGKPVPARMDGRPLTGK